MSTACGQSPPGFSDTDIYVPVRSLYVGSDLSFKSSVHEGRQLSSALSHPLRVHSSPSRPPASSSLPEPLPWQDCPAVRGVCDLTLVFFGTCGPVRVTSGDQGDLGAPAGSCRGSEGKEGMREACARSSIFCLLLVASGEG